MAESKRKTSAKQVNDVQKPGKTPAEDTSKPVIVNNRPILRDPMVTSEATTPMSEVKSAPELPKATPVPAPKPEISTTEITDEETVVPVVSTKHEMVLTPPSEATAEPEAETEPEPAAEAEAVPAKSEETKVAEDEPAATEKQDQPALTPDTSAEALEDAAQEAEANRQIELQKLADKKTYFLPINAIEQRRVEQFIALGILLSILLGLALLDIALDAGLIHFSNIHALTHFFSN